MHGSDRSGVCPAGAEGQLGIEVAPAARAERPEMGMHSRQGQSGAMALGTMTARLRRQGRPRGDAEQRSIRVPKGLWATLEKICEDINRRRDPSIDGKLKCSSLINVAIRDWLVANGHPADCYLDPADDLADDSANDSANDSAA